MLFDLFDQFQIYLICPSKYTLFILTNFLHLNLLVFSIVLYFGYFLYDGLLIFKNERVNIIHNILVIIFIFIKTIVLGKVALKKMSIFYVFFFLFILLLFYNLLGLIPYTYSITSYIYLTFQLSWIFFIYFNIIGLLYNKLVFFKIFYPSNVMFFLSIFLVGIEIILYIMKPISLAVRLSSNMISGHLLMKMLGIFCWTFLSLLVIKLNFINLIFLIFLIINFLIYLLETGVCMIQSMIFVVLLSTYLDKTTH